MEKHHIAHLEEQLRDLHTGLRDLASGYEVEELIGIIHKPGWTTVAEAELFIGLVESMVAQTRNLSSLQRVLFNGAAKVELNPQPLPPIG
jgi:hypothetical protein